MAHDESFQPLIRPMTIGDYDDVMTLMNATAGVSLRDADSRESTERYLTRNPDLSFVARVSDVLVGCVMCGHDGRRGYLQHLVVLPAYRHRGIASALIESCLEGLAGLGIFKTHIDVLTTNVEGQKFWKAKAWSLRTDIQRYSFIRSGGDEV